MPSVARVVVVSLVACLIGQLAGADEALYSDKTELRQKIEYAKSKVFPAVVNIRPISEVFSRGRKVLQASTGSGAIIDPAGHVITNHHVAGDAREFLCTLHDDQEVSARLVGTDPYSDLAIIQLALDELEPDGPPLPVAQFGDSDRLLAGDQILVMGSPLHLSKSIAVGILGNTERITATGRGQEDTIYISWGQPTAIYYRWLQFQAGGTNPGNSGGPIVNLKGEIIGIVARGIPGAVIGFGIPGNYSQEVAHALIKDGEVHRSWIGAHYQSSHLTEHGTGVLVRSVDRDSPAAQAGLLAGDLVTALNGEPVHVSGLTELPLFRKRIADYPIGSALTLSVSRQGESREFSVTTAREEVVMPVQAEFKAWGFTAADITLPIATRFNLDSQDGVLITGVRDGYPADQAKPPVQRHAILRRIDSTPIRNLADLHQVYAEREGFHGKILLETLKDRKSVLASMEVTAQEDIPPTVSIRKAWIGIDVQVVTQELADLLGLASAGGVRVTQVYAETKAAQSGLQVGDVLTHLNGEPIDAKLEKDGPVFRNAVRRLPLSETAQLTLRRGSEEVELAVALEASPRTSTEVKRVEDKTLDIVVRRLVFDDRVRNGWSEDLKGVMVMKIDSAGWAGLAGLRSGDLIGRINGQEVRGTKSFRQVMTELVAAKPTQISLFVQRRNETRIIYIDGDWK